MLSVVVSGDDLSKLLRGESTTDYRDLGPSKLVRSMSKRPDNLYGKWCGRCRGIWFGLPFEVECPVCGERRGAGPRRR